jgi:Xaa-Pro aminopeptidase
MHETMDRIRESILKYGHADEFTIQQFVLQRFKDNKLFTYSAPIIARDRNAASPHYAPDEKNSSTIQKDTTVLIDMWAKPAHGHGTYSDITWMCHTGNNPSELHKEIFSVIADARDAGISLIEKRLSTGIPIAGYEVDDAVRNHIIHKGFGEYFVHRTGHSITTETHGAGANMDNFETHDMRLLIPKTSFSIEPGIYINNQIGMRTEIDIVILEDGKPIITGLNPQKNLELLF